MNEARPVITAEEWEDQLRHGSPATPDDVCITSDGRRLDTPETLIAFIEELNALRADRDDQSRPQP